MSIRRLFWVPSAMVVAWTVTQPTELNSQQGTAQHRAVRELVIPGDGADYYFNRIASLAVAADKSILVLLPSECSVLHFDSKGRFVSKWGRNGSGPGEMRHPNLLGWYRDTLWVFDESLARITLFRQSGIPVRSIRLPVSGRGYLLNSGSVVALPSLIYGAGRRKGPPLLIRRYSQQGILLDTLLTIPPVYGILEYQRNGSTIVGTQPFEDGPIVKADANGTGFVIVERTVESHHHFTVTRIRPSGDTLFTHSYSYQPVSLSSHQFSRVVDQLLHDGPPIPDPDVRGRIEKALFRPAHLPSITEVVIGSDSTLWLRREIAEAPNVRWTVLRKDGVPQFDVNLPSSLYVQVASADAVWGIAIDDEGVPSVVRYRIQ